MNAVLRGSLGRSLGRVFSIAAPLAYMAAIFLLSSVALPVRLEGAPRHLDKLVHIVEYGLLGFLLQRGIHLGLRRPAVPWFVAACLATLYGVGDELHQAFVPGRSASWADVAADLVGAALGAALAARLLSGRAAPSRAAPGG